MSPAWVLPDRTQGTFRQYPGRHRPYQLNWQCAHRRCAPLGALKACPLGTFEILDAFSCNCTALFLFCPIFLFFYLYSVDERGGACAPPPDPQGPANKYISLRDRRSRREDTIFEPKCSIRFFRYYIKFLNKENMHMHILLRCSAVFRCRMPPLVALFADLYQFCTKYVLVTLESARQMC